MLCIVNVLAAVINLHSSSLDGSDGRGEAYTMIADGTMQQLHILFAAAHNYWLLDEGECEGGLMGVGKDC